MEEKSLYSYYMFGFNYNILLRAKDRTNSEFLNLLDEYYKFIMELDLPVTLSGIEQNNLGEDLEKLEKFNQLDPKRDTVVDEDLLNSIQSKLEKIDSILDAELGIKVAYVLGTKRYSNEFLMANMSKLFAENVYDSLPFLAQIDFDESGKCLALDRYTASAFHALRGTESIVILFYTTLMGKKPKTGATWGMLLGEIKNTISNDLISPMPSEELILNLDILRKFYRNKTQHPQRIYTSDEAQDLLGTCIKVVNEIYGDLGKRHE